MKINLKYTCSQGFFWMMYCVVTGYAAYFLLDIGFSTFEVGIYTTVFAICTAIMQVLIGRLADRSENAWKIITIILCAIPVIMDFALCMNIPLIVKGIVFGISYVSTSCVMPLVNQISFYYVKRGEIIDFGKARGMGSLLYAVYSFGLGKLTVMFGSILVPISGALASFLLLAVICSLPFISDSSEELAAAKTFEKEETVQTNQESNKSTNFIGRYKYFLLIWVGFCFIMIMHMMTGNYMLKIAENIGGDSSSMGIALAISAVAELPVMLSFKKYFLRFKSASLLVAAAIGFVIKSLMYVMASSISLLFFTQCLQMISFAIFANASVYFSDEQMSGGDKATGQSLMTNTLVIGQIVGNLLGGTLIDSVSVGAMTFAGFICTAIGTLIIVFTVMLHHKPKHI